jgi:hypothetical protein
VQEIAWWAGRSASCFWGFLWVRHGFSDELSLPPLLATVGMMERLGLRYNSIDCQRRSGQDLGRKIKETDKPRDRQWFRLLKSRGYNEVTSGYTLDSSPGTGGLSGDLAVFYSTVTSLPLVHYYYV